jgi:hypothetical protein
MDGNWHVISSTPGFVWISHQTGEDSRYDAVFRCWRRGECLEVGMGEGTRVGEG